MRSSVIRLVLLLFAIVAPAQEGDSSHQNPPESNRPTLQITSRLTVIDVIATDSKGRPIRGLTKSDFSVQEDGRPQVIKDFQEYSSQTAGSSSQSNPNVPTARVVTVANVLLFDDVATGGSLRANPENFAYARQEAIKYLKALSVAAHISVLELNNGIQVVHDFTSDQSALVAAVQSIRYRLLPEVSFSQSEPISLAMACAAMNRQDELTMVGLEQVLQTMRRTQGRKNLIWFTPGIPWLTDFDSYSRTIPCLHDYTSRLEEVYEGLAQTGVAIYPVDSRGLVDCPAGKIDECADTLVKDQKSLTDLAEETGGIAYYNRNGLAEIIGQVVALGNDYYSLSYVPPRSGYDGQHHKIDIRVDRHDVHLDYRPGYTAIQSSNGAERWRHDFQADVHLFQTGP